MDSCDIPPLPLPVLFEDNVLLGLPKLLFTARGLLGVAGVTKSAGIGGLELRTGLKHIIHSNQMV